MALPVSRHGRYDAKVRASSFDVNENIKASPSCQQQNVNDVPRCYNHQMSCNEVSEREEPRTRNVSRRLSLPLNMDNGPRPWSSGSDEGYVPSPPPRPPSSQRPRPQSSRRRTGSARMTQPVDSDLPNVSVMRPTSSFNKFRPLPSISSPSLDDETQEVTSKVDDLHLDSKHSEGKKSQKSELKARPVIKSKTNTPSPTSPEKYFTGPHVLPDEPKQEEDRLHLAVKLPTNGKRYHRYFSPEDYLQDLHHFAENVAEEDLSDYVLACNAPRKVFSNLTQRICDVCIPDKTVLYFEEKADT